ncbi:MAG: NfeD family protein [Clostridia bacterium]|nr:NfeD family protein [Clostridia bacterium]
MTQWWTSLGVTGQIFAIIAIPSTLVLIVQTVLLFFGIGDGDLDGATDLIDADISDGIEAGGDGLAVFSIRGIVAMLAVSGWSGLAMHQAGWDLWLVILLAAIFGILALLGIAYMMKAIMKLQDDGNMDLGGAIGKSGKVYIPIPGNMAGSGKINLTLQERFIEVDAVTPCDRIIKTGETVRVIATDEVGTLVVEPVIKD